MKKILIIKLGAKGDVVRTLPLLEAIKEEHPDSEIYWITKPQSKEILETHPLIDRLLIIPVSIEEQFDIMYNLDIDKEAIELAQNIIANNKYGFFSEQGFPAAFNLNAEYYLNTLFDDELKQSNEKTYQEMIFDVAELDYKKQQGPIHLTKKDQEYAKEFITKNNINTKNLIGIHMGASPRWPSKKWHKEKLTQFIIDSKQQGYEILLFGGPDEMQEHRDLKQELINKGIKIYTNHPENTSRQFASLVNLCQAIVCSDSFALHIALALKKPAIGLFFCTSPNEVEDYGLLKKIISPNLKEFFPQKMDQYDEGLIKSIAPNEVLEELKKILNKTIKNK